MSFLSQIITKEKLSYKTEAAESSTSSSALNLVANIDSDDEPPDLLKDDSSDDEDSDLRQYEPPEKRALIAGSIILHRKTDTKQVRQLTLKTSATIQNKTALQRDGQNEISLRANFNREAKNERMQTRGGMSPLL
jgi:hypothetical protein